jgi:hypothetical protein
MIKGDAILCRVGQAPQIITPFDELRRLGATLPYPAYLREGKGVNLQVRVRDDALGREPHNRWGLHGDFAVVVTAVREDRDDDARRIIEDLEREYGYLDPRAKAPGVIYAEQIGVFGLTNAPDFKGVWEPDRHWTGPHVQPWIKVINWLLLRYLPYLDAGYIYSPYPVAFSVEVQFRKTEEARAALAECRAIDLTDEHWNLLPEVIERPPLPWA